MQPLRSWLRSHETGQAFSHCIHCRMPLLELDEAWLVNKEFHHNECTLEYAICQSCRNTVSNQLSEESKQAVRDFLEHEIPWEQRIAEFLRHPDPAWRLEHCIACEAPRESCQGYSVSIQLDASGEPVLGALPLMMCEHCTERISQRLSAASRDAWDRFLRDHFDCPPQLSGLPGLL